MQDRLRQTAWVLGYIFVIGEALWLFAALLSVIGILIFGLGIQSDFVQQYLHYLALALSFFAKSLIPGVAMGFILLLMRDRSSWLPISLILFPLVGVAQSAALTVLAYVMDKPVSVVVMGASILWVLILSGGLWGLIRKKEVLWWMLGAVLLGIAWGVWLTFQFV